MWRRSNPEDEPETEHKEESVVHLPKEVVNENGREMHFSGKEAHNYWIFKGKPRGMPVYAITIVYTIK